MKNKVKLWEIAHARAGDKGDISNISLIPYNEKDYLLLKKKVTVNQVKKYFKKLVRGKIERYELPNVQSLNFVLHKALGGGVTKNLCLDAHGKSLSFALLNMEIELQDDKD